ncbi:MAG: D-alanine--D-alanine ligase family protein, partial [Bacteroidota bacterium]
VVKKDGWEVLDESGPLPFDLNIFGYFKNGQEIRFQYAWIAIHGAPGEDGRLQGYLDMMGIRYSGSGVLSSAITFNKHVCKTILRQHGVLTAESRLIVKGNSYILDEIIDSVGLPCFVKPNNSGSSFGVSRVNHLDKLESAIHAAFREDNEVLVESYVKGTEVSCGLFQGENEMIILPVTEIVSTNEFFDYEAKYTEGKSQEITPARIDDELTRRCQQTAARIYDITKSTGIVRIDFIIRGNQLYFLELNSIPGMSKESIVPKQIQAAGYRVEDILRKVVERSLQ